MAAGRKFKVTDVLFADPSPCPVPAGLTWDMEKFPVQISYKPMPGGRRKGVVEGFTPFSGTAGTPYANCRAGTTYHVDVVAGNDSSGAGTSGNPYKTRDKAMSVANAAGQPCTIRIRATGFITRTTGSTWLVAPTVDVVYLAAGGTVVLGAFDNYAWVADTVNNAPGVFRIQGGRGAVSEMYDKTRFDAFGNFALIPKAKDLATCHRVPGTWFMDTSSTPASPIYNPIDGQLPTNATVMPLVHGAAGDGLDRTMGNNPVNVFFDGETSGDGFEVRGHRIKIFSAAYGATEKIAALRRVSSRYCGTRNDADTANGISFDNVFGISWVEDCYIGGAAYDSINAHNSLGSKLSLLMTVNNRCENPGMAGVAAVGSQNNLTLHENCVGISLCDEFDFSRGGNLANINASKMLVHGSRISRDRGDIDVQNAVNHPTEIRVRDSSLLYLSETEIIAGPGGYAINSDSSAAVQLRNMESIRGRVSGLTAVMA